MRAIVSDLMLLEKEGVEAYDAKLQQTVLVVSPLMCIVADNPHASEILNHLGGSAKRYCRICMVNKTTVTY